MDFENHLVLKILSSYFLTTQVPGFTRFELRKQLIRLKSCSKTIREYQFYEGLMIKFNFSDFNKMRAFTYNSQTSSYYSISVINTFKLKKLLLNYKFWTIIQFRIYITFIAYRSINIGSGSCHSAIEIHINNQNNPLIVEAYKNIFAYTPENLYSVFKLMTRDELLTMAF